MILTRDDLAELILAGQCPLKVTFIEVDQLRLRLISLLGALAKLAILIVPERPKLSVVCQAQSVKCAATDPDNVAAS